MSNLIPQNEKKEIYKVYKWRVATSFLGAFFVLIIVLIGVTAPSYLVFYNKNKSLEVSIAALESGERGVGVKTDIEEIKKVNTQLSVLESVVNKEEGIADSLEDILLHKEKNISIKSINSNDGETFEIRGSANDRDGLLVFIQSLEDSSKIKNVESPISNLLAEKDAEFLITLQIGHE